MSAPIFASEEPEWKTWVFCVSLALSFLFLLLQAIGALPSIADILKWVAAAIAAHIFPAGQGDGGTPPPSPPGNWPASPGSRPCPSSPIPKGKNIDKGFDSPLQYPYQESAWRYIAQPSHSRPRPEEIESALLFANACRKAKLSNRRFRREDHKVLQKYRSSKPAGEIRAPKQHQPPKPSSSYEDLSCAKSAHRSATTAILAAPARISVPEKQSAAGDTRHQQHSAPVVRRLPPPVVRPLLKERI